VYLRPPSLRRRSCWTLAFVILLGIGPGPSKMASSTVSSLEDAKESLPHLSFIREFSGADDVTRQEHPVFDRSLDIIAGPAEPRATQGNLVAPTGVATDSRHRVFVADEGAGIVMSSTSSYPNIRFLAAEVIIYDRPARSRSIAKTTYM
jgi:hypothetical protein